MTIRALLTRVSRDLFFLTAFLLALLFSSSPTASAQQSQMPATQFTAPKKRAHPIEKKLPKEEPLVTPDGILTKAYQSKRPWEMVSPFAPDSYGTGEEMVSENPDELGKQNGLVVFGIEW